MSRPIKSELEKRLRDERFCSNMEFRIKKSGKLRHFDVNASLLARIGEEETGATVSIWRETTERSSEIAKPFAMVLMICFLLSVCLFTGRVDAKDLSEEKLRQRNEELSSVLDAIPALVWIAEDPECHVITGNRYVNDLFGVVNDTNVSQTGAKMGQAVKIIHLKPDGTELQAEDLPMQQSIARGEAVRNVEFSYLLPDGRQIFAIGNAVPLFDEHGRIRGSVGAFLDITETKQASAKLQKRTQTFLIAAVGFIIVLGIILIVLTRMWQAAKRDKRALRERESQLRQIIDLVPHFIFVKDETGKFEIVNKATAEVFGTTVEDLTGRRDSEFVETEEEMEHFRSDDLEVINSGKTKFIPEEPITDSENNIRYLQTTKVPFTISGSEKPALLGVAIDITNIKLAEQALRESEMKLNTLLNATTDVAGLFEADGTMISANGALAKSLGRKKEELIGKPMFEYLSAEVAERRSAVLQGIVASKKPLQWDDERAGRYFANALYPIFDDNGNVKQIALFARDITEQKKAEEALKEKQQTNDLLLNSMPYPIMLINKARVVMAANKIAMDIGVNIGDYCWKSFGKCEYLSDKDQICARENPDASGMQCTFCRADEMFKANEPANDPEVSAFGRLWDTYWIPLNDNEYLHYGIDITEQKQAEEQMAASLKEKEALLREIHHRTKNNMQVMISLLRIQSENTENKQFAGMLKESWNRIKSMALVHEKLYRSKGLADVDFKGYVKSLVSGIFSSYGASAAGITSIAETDDVSIGLETAIPCGLIINELVSNSLKYAFPGNRKGKISVALRSFDEDALVLEVGDNGIGMPEDLDFRNTTSMGLHLVQILSEGQLHGKIELDRAGGTTFRIRFKNHKYEARI